MSVAPKSKSRWRRGKWILLTFALLGLAACTFRTPLLIAAACFLDVSQPLAPCDYVMVLGGDHQTRPFLAASLVERGLARNVLIPQAQLAGDVQDGLTPAEHDLMRAVLVRQGVPPESIQVLDGTVASTFDEAHALRRFLAQRPGARVTIVTSSFHTRRTRWIFFRILGSQAASLQFAGAPHDRFHERNWWRSEDGVASYLLEYLKLAGYLVTY